MVRRKIDHGTMRKRRGEGFFFLKLSEWGAYKVNLRIPSHPSDEAEWASHS